MKAIEKALNLLSDYIDETGGCDHSVGFCICEDKKILQDALSKNAHANGWVQVPIIPTYLMLDKMTGEWHPDKQVGARIRYSEMINAAQEWMESGIEKT